MLEFALIIDPLDAGYIIHPAELLKDARIAPDTLQPQRWISKLRRGRITGKNKILHFCLLKNVNVCKAKPHITG